MTNQLSMGYFLQHLLFKWILRKVYSLSCNSFSVSSCLFCQFSLLKESTVKRWITCIQFTQSVRLPSMLSQCSASSWPFVPWPLRAFPDLPLAWLRAGSVPGVAGKRLAHSEGGHRHWLTDWLTVVLVTVTKQHCYCRGILNFMGFENRPKICNDEINPTSSL